MDKKRQLSRVISPIFYVVLAFLVFGQAAGSWAQQVYLNISDPFLRKIPVAVPLFKPLTGGAVEDRLAGEAREILVSDLEFTGYMTILDPLSYIENPATKGITRTDLNFKNWTVIGSELVVTCGIVESGGDLELKMRLFDPFTERLVVGKVYTGKVNDLRRMIHRFCSEISFHLTGKWGVFSSRLAFVSTKGKNKEIFVAEFDGHNSRQVTRLNSISISPAWSSDGQWLAYTSYAGGNPDIYIKNLIQNRGAVVNFKGMNITPAWIPGQFSLAAALSFENDQEIYLLTGKGRIIKKLTNSWGIDVSPCFSPDGKKMAFVSKRAGTPQVYIQDMESDTVRRLTFTGRYNTSPAWSPDGDKIAYVGIANGEINIYVVGIDGSGVVQLTSSTGDNEDPCWSPDAGLIAFTSTREGVARIYVMTATGGEQRRLFLMDGAQTNPEWSRGNENN
ncbi:AglW [Desulforapulum autotrophicum HRM2]|uniref:AglW n=1 Tax=Desulforapulum autotrophicum (strain ATCC 43914 / DSM 3382 / VKM B-1955 / HRM2) TaxID=177437 RepID=C0QKP9_DESAH|nr:Tol-Pal system beta propeller repeat protein TolB [Desulforapulum autotrophicum]ACN16139.1 AglW [Desulforapulum autotrophicum HRM2]